MRNFDKSIYMLITFFYSRGFGEEMVAAGLARTE